MASMMDEMQKTLARRRAKVDRGSEEPDSNDSGDRRDGMEKAGSPGKPFSQPGSQAGSESPKPGRRRHSTRGSICGPDADIMSSSLNAGMGGGESRVDLDLPCILDTLAPSLILMKLCLTIHPIPQNTGIIQPH